MARGSCGDDQVSASTTYSDIALQRQHVARYLTASSAFFLSKAQAPSISSEPTSGLLQQGQNKQKICHCSERMLQMIDERLERVELWIGEVTGHGTPGLAAVDLPGNCEYSSAIILQEKRELQLHFRPALFEIPGRWPTALPHSRWFKSLDRTGTLWSRALFLWAMLIRLEVL